MLDKLDTIAEFRKDHRKVRDSLLELASTAEGGDMTKSRAEGVPFPRLADNL